MSAGFKHFSKWGFGDVVWHKASKDKGLIIGIHLRANTPPAYAVVFEDNRQEEVCLEFELLDEQPTSIESSREKQ